ncbi:hypothetical protein ASPZODRAFT_1230306 [Penicilliopsis zonata CBS 506.65]|uniref:Zn(2)-C6 fungal-type domain-containing protein n=1 Tax=Penicilliopsis zonata CBS 506.65 TaxID=1073090 RepID=A0A1L9S7M1_9EURO|nr:hypothetical protein ASPZODRAFT_1230306 [Penicilliopsis zonata CBS 506.65]OJJ43163.1 hypothetical protein ASPZODRAFT_1230306 [Penicilliopsis zonata CBS 506.65]
MAATQQRYLSSQSDQTGQGLAYSVDDQVKCSGEKNGCRRCRALGTTCRYNISMVGRVPGVRQRHGKNHDGDRPEAGLADEDPIITPSLACVAPFPTYLAPDSSLAVCRLIELLDVSIRRSPPLDEVMRISRAAATQLETVLTDWVSSSSASHECVCCVAVNLAISLLETSATDSVLPIVRFGTLTVEGEARRSVVQTMVRGEAQRWLEVVDRLQRGQGTMSLPGVPSVGEQSVVRVLSFWCEEFGRRLGGLVYGGVY